MGRQFKEVGREAGQLGRRVATGALAASAALGAIVGRFGAAGENLQLTALRLGLNVEQLQRLRYAAAQSGVKVETFDMALQRFGRRAGEAAHGMGEAQGALAFLGTQLRDTDGKIRPVNDMFLETVDVLSKIESPAKRNALAMKLFDSEGVSLVQMMKGGRGEIEKWGDESEQLGIVTEQQAKAATEFMQELRRFQQVVKDLTFAIGDELLPVYKEIVTAAREWITENKTEIVEQFTVAVDDLAEAFRFVVEMVRSLVDGGSELLEWIRGASPRIGEIIDTFIGWAKEIGGVKAAAILLAGFLGKGLILAIVGLTAPLTALAALLIANPFVLLVAALAGGVYLIYDNWDGIVQYFEDIWKGIKDAFDFEWLNKAASSVGGIFGGEGAAAAEGAGAGGSPSAGAFVPAFLGDHPSAAAGGKASVIVDFRNMPRGTRTETRADSNTDLEVNTGYAMQGAQ